MSISVLGSKSSSKTSTIWVAGWKHTVGSLQDFPGLEMVGSGGSPDILEAGGRWKVEGEILLVFT